LIITAAGCAVLIAMMGLAFDVGRLYIVKNEGQAYCDAAVIVAAEKLNGKSSGISDATNAVQNMANYWNWNTTAFTSSNRTVEFSNSQAGPWTTSPPSNPVGYAFVRVTVNPNVPLYFLPAVQNLPGTTTVVARAIGGQVPQVFNAGGYLPFTPFAQNVNDPNFGFQVGQEYGMLWPGNINKKQNACAGDQTNWPAYNMSDQVSGSTRGYYELQAASAIADAIQGLRQTSPLAVGDTLNMTNGQKQAMQNALLARANLDTDRNSYNPSPGTAPSYNGNGMRLVVMPVNSGPNSIPPYKVVGFASFLLGMSYPSNGTQAWCAIYMGSTVAGGGSSAYSGAGAYVVKLLQ
jgi:Flp pilus assembly protein TadG